MKDSITGSELLEHLLRYGWEWKKSDEPGYVCLSKNEFSWLIRPESFNVWTLIEMLYRRGERNPAPEDLNKEKGD